MKVITKLLNNEKFSSDLIVKKVNGKAKPIDYFQYSTQEQFTGDYWIDGKKIYEKTIDIGALPNNAVNGTKHVIHDIKPLNRIVEISGVASSSAEAIPLPHVNPWSLSESVVVRVDGSNIIIGTNSDKSGYKGYVTLKYTK